MIYSDWIDRPPTSDTIIDGSNLTIAHIPAPELTAAIIDQGTVLVYMRFGGGVWLLPYTSNAGGSPNTIDFIAKAGDIIVTRFRHDNVILAIAGTLDFRYVLIPGGLPAEANVANYTAMQHLLGIPD